MLKQAVQHIVHSRLIRGDLDGVTLQEGIQAHTYVRSREKRSKRIQMIDMYYISKHDK